MRRTKQELFRSVLVDKLRELHSAIAEKRADGINDFEESEPDVYDLCVQSYSKEQLYSLCERDRQLLSMVKDALLKMAQDSYGLCEECQDAINERRLEALPWVRLCINCQNRREQEIAA